MRSRSKDVPGPTDVPPKSFAEGFSDMLKHYCNPIDSRYEDLVGASSPTFYRIIFCDTMAGLILAMVGIPLSMCFAIASGLQPGQALLGGAFAGLIGALFGGSKYQVYGPTAAFIPVIHGIMALNMKGGPFYSADVSDAEMARLGHGLLVFVSLTAGLLLLAFSLCRAGTLISKVPNCIMVGFTIGIAVTISVALLEEALGIERNGTYNHGVWPKLVHVYEQRSHVNNYAVVMACGTLLFIQALSRISVLIPAALFCIVFWTVIAETLWAEKGLKNVFDIYGHIQQQVTFTPPLFYPVAQKDAIGNAMLNTETIVDAFAQISYYVIYIVFVGLVESLLCLRMADSLANNRGTPFDPNKELWGSGWVNALAPLLNGFPHTAGFARTGVNIKLGARTPLAGIVQFFLKLAMIFVFAKWLELMPVACIAGLLWYTALNMISAQEVAKVNKEGGWSMCSIMWMTAVLVVVTDVLKGVACGMMLYTAWFVAVKYLPNTISGIPCTSRLRFGDVVTDDEEQTPLLPEQTPMHKQV